MVMIYLVNCGSTWIQEIQNRLSGLGYSHKVVPMEEAGAHDLSIFSGVIISGSPILLTQVDLQKYKDFLGFVKKVTVPVLGICFGHQMIGILYGSHIFIGEQINEKIPINIVKDDVLFSGVENHSLFREAHYEYITLPENFYLLAKSDTCGNEAMKHKDKNIYGTQFHPEVSDNAGEVVLKNFLHLCS